MSVVRVNKTSDYTVMSNHHFKNRKLSLKAKGLLSQMLSLPDNWDYTVIGLCAINKENETAITSALNELKEQGYLVVTKLMPNQTQSGRIEYVYDIYEQPQEKQGIDFQGIEIQSIENQILENPTQLNTKESSTKNKKLNIKNVIYQYTEDIELREALEDFAEMRKTIKKPICTERAWKILLSKLDKLSPDITGKIAVLNQSIEHNWQSVYPLDKPMSKRQINGNERLGWIDDI